MANNKNIKINLDYSEFSGGIADCQRKMGLLTEQFKMQQSALGNNATELDKLTLSQSSLSSKIELQIQIVEKASERYKALAESEGASAAQVDNAQRSYMKQITTLNQLTQELEQVNNKIDEAIEEENNMASSSDNASQSSQGLAASITTTAAVMASLIAAAKQVAEAIAEVATKSTEWADDLATLSAQIGVSTTTLQEWAYAASFVDVSVETLQGSMSKLTRAMGEAQNGSASAQQAFKALGVEYQNLDGSLKSSEQVFYEVIDALGQIDNQAERDAASMAIFGRSAQELNTLIEAGSGSLQAYGQEAHNLGIIMSESDVQALASMQDSFDRLDQVMDAAGKRVSAVFAPAFADLADALSTLDPTILAVFSGMGSLINVVSSLAPLLQATAAFTQLLTMAKSATTVATIAETGAEAGLGVTAMATNAALLPQIAIAALLMAAVAALALAIYEIIQLFNDEADAADKAANSTQKFADAASGAESSSDSSNNSSSSKKHYALGGRTSGGRVWVGEQGAELVDLPAGSYVHNSTEVNQMTNGNNVTNITVNVDHISELDDLLRISKQAKQRSRMGVFA